MIFANIKEFQKKALTFIRDKNEVIITKYGKPVAKLVSFSEEEDNKKLEEYFSLNKKIFKNIDNTKKNQIKDIMKDVKKEIYG
jgi:antitoxin (DNA-binding transcriptional repressor) of toxin-antitoxin stability system